MDFDLISAIFYSGRIKLEKTVRLIIIEKLDNSSYNRGEDIEGWVVKSRS